MALIFERIQTDGIAQLSYLVGDDSEGVAAIFDPRADVDCYLELAREKQVSITHKFNILIGQLLLEDWTVAKIMLTAMTVGMVGIFTLRHFTKLNLDLKPTRIGANIIGGLLFGAGFALLGYCPGTAAAALGQGSWDALFGMAGLVVGSWIFAEFSATLRGTVEKWGDFGKVVLPDLLHVPRGVFVAVFTVLLVLGLVALEIMFAR